MFDRYPEAGPLYWFKNSKLNKDEIFIYDEKKNLSLKELRQIQNLGFNFKYLKKQRRRCKSI